MTEASVMMDQGNDESFPVLLVHHNPRPMTKTMGSTDSQLFSHHFEFFIKREPKCVERIAKGMKVLALILELRCWKVDNAIHR